MEAVCLILGFRITGFNDILLLLLLLSSLLLSLILEVPHEEVESEVAENRYFVTETILTPGIQPLGSYDLVDDHQLFCLVSHVTLKQGKIVNPII